MDNNLLDFYLNEKVQIGLIPFLEHDDANRALMGSNMQRQAVPLVNAEAPYIGTGLETVVARDTEVLVAALEDGEVIDSDSFSVTVKEKSKTRKYELQKYQRTNQNTCRNQKPFVYKGAKVKNIIPDQEIIYIDFAYL
mgnify:CR=1 FL=1